MEFNLFFWGSILFFLLIFFYSYIQKNNDLFPSSVFVLLNIIFLFGGFLFFYTGSNMGVSLGASFDTSLRMNDVFSTLVILFKYNSFILLGILFYWKLYRYKGLNMMNQIIFRSNLSSINFNNVSIGKILLGFLPILFYVIGAGDNLIVSDSYLENNIKLFSSLGNMTVLPFTMLLGLYYNNVKAFFKKILIIIIISFIIIILFSRATRLLSLVPLFFWVGNTIIGGQRINYFKFFLLLLFTLLLLSIPLYLRSGNSYGLLPNLEKMSHYNYNRLLDDLPIFFNNIFSSYSLVHQIYDYRFTYNISYYFVSINPMPGFLTNWYVIAPELRLNKYTPFNTIGELFLYGDLIAFFTTFLFGFFFGLLDLAYLKIRLFAKNGTHIFFIAIPIVMAITSMQYNLRTTCRFVYYLIILSVLLNFLFNKFYKRKMHV